MVKKGTPGELPVDGQIAMQLVTLLEQRDGGASVCPSEIARAVVSEKGGNWRALMPRVRDVVAELARQQRVVVTRGPAILSPDDLAGGPIRIRRGKRFVGSA